MKQDEHNQTEGLKPLPAAQCSVKTYHLSQSVRGPLLNWSEEDWIQAVEWISRKDGTRFSPLELKAAFLEHVAQGHNVIPIGDCDNFDYKKGCQGHSPNAELMRHRTN